MRLSGLRRQVRGVLPTRAVHAVLMLLHTRLRPFEPELAVVPRFLAPDKVAIDAGANLGLFAGVLARGSSRVIAFEPNPQCAAHLRSLRLRNCEVVEAALSNTAGRTLLRVPVGSGDEMHTFGSIEVANDLRAAGAVSVMTHDVERTTLDIALAARLAAGEPVGFVKIDVEGHEMAVLEGAGDVIARNHPVLLIEVEFRHSPQVDEVFAFLHARGYGASALVRRNGLEPIDATRLRDLQSAERLERKMADPRDRSYIHNVFFLPEGV